jgi:hypothetical protein
MRDLNSKNPPCPTVLNPVQRLKVGHLDAPVDKKKKRQVLRLSLTVPEGVPNSGTVGQQNGTVPSTQRQRAYRVRLGVTQ